MTQETQLEKPIQASNERAVAWARQAMAHKRAEQKRMQEEFDNDPKAQALVKRLFELNKQQK